MALVAVFFKKKNQQPNLLLNYPRDGHRKCATMDGPFSNFHGLAMCNSFCEGLLHRVGSVVTWVTWVIGLCGSVGYVDQIFTWVAWATLVKIFLRGSTFYVGPKFLRGSIFLLRESFFMY